MMQIEVFTKKDKIVFNINSNETNVIINRIEKKLKLDNIVDVIINYKCKYTKDRYIQFENNSREWYGLYSCSLKANKINDYIMNIEARGKLLDCIFTMQRFGVFGNSSLHLLLVTDLSVIGYFNNEHTRGLDVHNSLIFKYISDLNGHISRDDVFSSLRNISFQNATKLTNLAFKAIYGGSPEEVDIDNDNKLSLKSISDKKVKEIGEILRGKIKV